MSSRLDKLFQLLTNGSDPAREQAGRSLADILSVHPDDLTQLLDKLLPLFKSTDWNTRVAAGNALVLMLREISWERELGVLSIYGNISSDDSSSGFALSSPVSEDNKLSICCSETVSGGGLETFDLCRLLSQNRRLVASEGSEYDVEREYSIAANNSIAPGTLRQRVDSQLGINPSFGLSTKDWFSDDDLTYHVVPTVIMGEGQPLTGVSQINPTLQHIEVQNCGVVDAATGLSATKRRKVEQQHDACDSSKTLNPVKNEIVKEEEEEEEHSVSYQVMLDFTRCCLRLLQDPKWEWRHGAALALKAILGGFSHQKPLLRQLGSIQLILSHWASTILQVMALDRFNDFVGDHAVAPVRETCAQALALLSSCLHPQRARFLLEAVFQFSSPEMSWSVQLCSLLVFKYLILSHPRWIGYVECQSIGNFFLNCLGGQNEDISSVAAEVILILQEHMPDEQIRHFLANAVVWDICWTTLGGGATTSFSPEPFLKLIALYELKDLVSATAYSEHYFQVLFPYLDHGLCNVRRSALDCFRSITGRISSSCTVGGSVADTGIVCSLIQPLSQILFQRMLFETDGSLQLIIVDIWDNLCDIVEAGKLTCLICPFFGVWLSFLMLPLKDPKLDASLVYSAHHPPSAAFRSKTYYIGSDEVLALKPGAQRDQIVIRNKVRGAQLLGRLCPLISSCNDRSDAIDTPAEALHHLLMLHLCSHSAQQQMSVCMVISRWAAEVARSSSTRTGDKQQGINIGLELEQKLLDLLSQPTPYHDETSLGFADLSRCAAEYSFLLCSAGYDIGSLRTTSFFQAAEVQALLCLPLDEVETMSDAVDNATAARCPPAKKYLCQVTEKRAHLLAKYSTISDTSLEYSLTVNVWLASALVSLGSLPLKLNPIVKPLMDCVKMCSGVILGEATDTLAHVIGLIALRHPCPVPKIVKNLSTFLCTDKTVTPSVSDWEGRLEDSILLVKVWTADNTRQGWDKLRTGPPVTREKDCARQASQALKTVVSHFGPALPSKVPYLVDELILRLNSVDSLQNLVNQVHLVETVFSSMDPSIQIRVVEKYQHHLLSCLSHANPAVRHISARGLVLFIAAQPADILNDFIPSLHGCASENFGDASAKLGALEFVLSLTAHVANVTILRGWVALLVLPVMSFMADQVETCRQLASLSFASLIKLISLETATDLPKGLSEPLVELRKEQFGFLDQLSNASSSEEALELPFELKAELRPYQAQGVRWLRFLRKYGLHGILCDDMGLGKTLQTLTALAWTKVEQCPGEKSLIICPGSVAMHWKQEVAKWLDPAVLSSVALIGGIGMDSTSTIEHHISEYDIIIVPYELVRRESMAFTARSWHYCILDEGHVIKNPKTQLFKAITGLRARYRLILSGTPIQNSVLELWSLFQFLMPGYLGSLQGFTATYARPIQQARDAKVTAEETTAGQRALDSLHKQVLPFILRRQKADVLKHLPPKIIQDYYCDLSDQQTKLYLEMSETLRSGNTVGDDGEGGSVLSKGRTAFHVLSYLRQLCDHPNLVLRGPAGRSRVDRALGEAANSPYKPGSVGGGIVEQSGKLLALRQLLSECGIGDDDSRNVVVSEHRALVFCQFRAMIDLIETCLRNNELGSGISHLRLDGSVPVQARQGIVDRFNADPSVDLLLLTTQVGGLGLTLTGADVVIFIDHDWNPTKDLQAMDRAHRIGQTRTVNVYRIITRGTLEEKIMKLQDFKTRVANTVIGEDNRSMASMAMDQLLDLLTLDNVGSAQIGSVTTQEDGAAKEPRPTGSLNRNMSPRSAKSNSSARDSRQSKINQADRMVGVRTSAAVNLGTLWDESQYEEAFDTIAFMKSLNSAPGQ